MAAQNEVVPQVEANNNQDSSVLLEWTAPARPFKIRTKEFYKTAVSLMVLISLILVFMGEFLLIGVIVSTFFVYYVLSTVPPDQIKNKITKLGIETSHYFHKWEEMREFWFEDVGDEKMLVLHTYIGFPAHLRLMINPNDQNKIKALLTERMPYQEKPQKTFLDKASSWLSRKIPLEKTT